METRKHKGSTYRTHCRPAISLAIAFGRAWETRVNNPARCLTASVSFSLNARRTGGRRDTTRSPRFSANCRRWRSLHDQAETFSPAFSISAKEERERIERGNTKKTKTRGETRREDQEREREREENR